MRAATLFDVILIATTLWLGWKTISDRNLFRATVHFIGLGLIVAIAWARLRAPDVALAEAAVGSGLTGALVITTVAAARSRGNVSDQPSNDPDARDSESAATVSPWWRGVAAALSFVLAVMIGGALISMPSAPRGLTGAALGALGRSGVSNPVTAALLNYRGYDTLLETVVLLVAVMAVWSIRAVKAPPAISPGRGALPLSLVRVILPSLIVGAGYLLWRGAFAPGGAFQAGALLGGAGVLLLGCGVAHPDLRHAPVLRITLTVGPLVFTLVSLGLMLPGAALLEYPPGSAKYWILAIEVAATVSIGVTLAALYLGGRPATGADR